MALQRSILLCGLLWWHEGVAMPLGPPSPAVSRQFPAWGGEGRPRHADPSTHRRDFVVYHAQPRDRGTSHQIPSYRDNQANYDVAGRRADFGRSGNDHSYQAGDSANRHDIRNLYAEPLNRYDRTESNLIRKRQFLHRGEEKSSFQRTNNIRYKENDHPRERQRVERMFSTSDPFRQLGGSGSESTQRRKYAPKEESFSPYGRERLGLSNSFNGEGSYASSNVAADSRTSTTGYHFIENAKTGRDSNFMHHHQSSSNERHFRFLSDGFRGPISSGHYEDVPGTSGSYYRRPGGLTNNNDVLESHQPKAPRPLLQTNQVWQERPRDEAFSYRDARDQNPQSAQHLPRRQQGRHHQSYFNQDSAISDHFRSDRSKLSSLHLRDEQKTIPIQPQLLVKEVELPNPQPLDTSSHHPYSLLYFHYLPKENSS